MKKIITSFVIFSALLTANAYAASVGSKCNVYVPISSGGFGFDITALFWRPSTHALDYAILFPDSTSFDNGRVLSVEPNYDLGVQAYISYAVPCSGNDIRLTYTHYDKEHEKGAVARPPTRISPASAPSPVRQQAVPSVTLTAPGELTPVGIPPRAPRFIGFLTSNFVGAKIKFEQNTWDLDVGQSINVGCNFHLRWAAGLRYANLDNHFDETINGINNAITSEFVGTVVFDETTATDVVLDLSTTSDEQDLIHQKSKFDGIGPRLGMDMSYDLGCGFSVVGNLSTALIVGEIESTLNENQTLENSSVTILGATGIIDGVLTDLGATFPGGASAVAVPDETNVRSFHLPNETRVIPNIDAKLGLAYTYQFCNCSHTRLGVEAGYMVNHFFNSFDRLSDISLDTPEFRSNHTMDVSFDGPYVGIKLSL